MSCIGFETIVPCFEVETSTILAFSGSKEAQSYTYLDRYYRNLELSYPILVGSKKDRLLPYKDQIWAFHHIGSAVVSKVKVANSLPVCIVVVNSFVETDEAFFPILSTDDGIVLALKLKFADHGSGL